MNPHLIPEPDSRVAKYLTRQCYICQALGALLSNVLNATRALGTRGALQRDLVWESNSDRG